MDQAPVPLTLAMVQDAIAQDHGYPEYPNLTRLITATFSTFEGLNGSFPLALTKLSYSRPAINFDDLSKFYKIIQSLPTKAPARLILQLTLNLLKRPRHKLNAPSDIYLLLITLENPILYAPAIFTSHDRESIYSLAYNVLERSVAILSHTPNRSQHYLLNWISRYPTLQFTRLVRLLSAYISHRLVLLAARLGRKHDRSVSMLEDNLLLMHSPGVASGGPRRAQSQKSPRKQRIKISTYGRDWRLAAFATIQAVFFNANSSKSKIPISVFYNTMVDNTDFKGDYDSWERMGAPTSLLQTSSQVRTQSSTYSTSAAPRLEPMLDINGSVEQAPLFAFCQFPFLLSLAPKKYLLEYDARRKMEYEVHEAFFNALNNHSVSQPYLHIKVRRDNLLHDSFEFFSTHEEELKKAIRVEFIGEPGIDAGGLKKEWFLLLVRELFDPTLGLFTEDEESGYCWFNTVSSQPLKFYKLTGVALGLALYNSTNLDINFPPGMFKRLLGCPYNLKDFTKMWPSYGRSLQALLDYEGDDFESTFGLTFSVTRPLENGGVQEEPIASNGLNRPVTKSTRSEYVRRVVAYYMEGSVKRQFEPLKQGFYKVLGSNALTLFQPEEIELLIRGSDEPLDIPTLRAVTRYKNWDDKTGSAGEPDNAPVIKWFWEYFETLPRQDQQRLLMFVTGSDRVPAMGIATMSFKITRLYGGDSHRFPTAHTCFNELCLYEYKSKDKLIAMLERAISESEGFGLR